MRFQITTEDGKVTEYDSFSQCGKEMGLKPRTLYRFLHNEAGGGKFTRRSDGKVFWIEGVGKDKLIPLMKIDGEDFFSVTSILKRFGLGETKFFNQLKKNPFGFIDAAGKPHKVDSMLKIISDVLEIEKIKSPNEKVKRQLKCTQTLGGRKATGAVSFLEEC